MKKFLTFLSGVLLLTVVAGQDIELQDKLKSVKAPSQEFIRIPADYVLKKLSEAARASGDPALAAFSAKIDDPALANKRISVNVEGMSLHDALKAVSNVLGRKVKYSSGRAGTEDHSQIEKRPSASEPPFKAEREASKPEQKIKKREKKKEEESEPVSFSAISRALVFVHNGSSKGTGFIGRLRGKVYVFSNQHNFKGATRINLRAMNGRMLRPVSFEYVKTRDLVRFELPESEMRDLEALNVNVSEPSINMPIIVYGNSDGDNVMTELKGKIVGVGPSDIEVDADIVPGNSGSPIIDRQGNVMGVATYLRLPEEFDKNDPRSKIYRGTRFTEPRRYGVRIPEKGWIKVPVNRFLNQTYRLEDLEHYYDAMLILTQFWSGNEDFIIPAKRLFSAYSRSGQSVKPPYKFHDLKVEGWLRSTIRSFKINYDEFALNAENMNRTDRAMAINHICIGLINALNRAQDTLKTYPWMSSYLKELAKPLEQLGDELIGMIESMKRSDVFSQKSWGKHL